MKKTIIGTFTLISVAGFLGAAVMPNISLGAPDTSTLQGLIQETQRLGSYEAARSRVFAGDGDPHTAIMVTDPRDVSVVVSYHNGLWVGRTNLSQYPRVYGGYFGNFIWGYVTNALGAPNPGAWFFGTRENGRFAIWNLFGNRANGVWHEIQ